MVKKEPMDCTFISYSLLVHYGKYLFEKVWSQFLHAQRKRKVFFITSTFDQKIRKQRMIENCTRSMKDRVVSLLRRRCLEPNSFPSFFEYTFLYTFRFHIVDEINNSRCISHLIIVPSNKLIKCWRKRDPGSSIKYRRALIPYKI